MTARRLTEERVEEQLEIQVAAFRAMGHPMSATAIDRCRRLLRGEITFEEGQAEIAEGARQLRSTT